MEGWPGTEGPPAQLGGCSENTETDLLDAGPLSVIRGSVLGDGRMILI